MKKKSYKRRRGDFEVRILSDGRMVLIAPDESMLEIAREIERGKKGSEASMEKMNGGRQ
jgi:hypothetical protein